MDTQDAVNRYNEIFSMWNSDTCYNMGEVRSLSKDIMVNEISRHKRVI